MTIRLEKKSDYQAVEQLIREAFWNVYKPGCDEHYVMHLLRQDSSFVPELDYVTEDQGQIIAQIVYANGTLIDSDKTETPVLLFGPVSVNPVHQGRGIGQALIEFTLNKAQELGYPAVLITGNPEYYQKFGFGPASSYGIYLQDMNPNEPAPFFMIKVLDEKKAQELKGVFYHPRCYQVNEAELMAYDKRFPDKEKLVLPGQLWS